MNCPEHYFAQCIEHLKQFRWIYDMKVTDFFLNEVWKSIPIEWQTYFSTLSFDDLNLLVEGGLNQEQMPDSLKTYLNDSMKLTLLKHAPFSSSFHLSTAHKSFSKKKLHEIERLGGLISNLCQKHKCKRIIDIGCGLGYLSTILSTKLGLTVVGVDCSVSYCNKATEKYGNSNTTFESLTIEDSREMDEKLLAMINDDNGTHQAELDVSPLMELSIWRQNDRCVSKKEDSSIFMRTVSIGSQEVPTLTGLVSLHGCGDLQPNLIRFLARTRPKNACFLVSIGCCYHKTENDSAYFPLSLRLKNVIGSNFGLNSFALRLACQETASKWSKQNAEQHKTHRNNVAFRGVLEVAISMNGWNMEKRKRRLTRAADCTDLDRFIDAVVKRATIDTSPNLVREALKNIYEKHYDYFAFIEPFTALQTLMQGVLESLILYDRLYFAEESQFFAEIIPVFDSVISPRNNALIMENTH